MSLTRPVLVVLYKDELPEGMAAIEEIADVRYARASELAASIRGAEILLLWDFFSSALADAWQNATSLRWVHVAAAGVDSLLFDGLIASDVIVTNSRGIFDRPIAEFVLASILAMAKDIPGSLRRQQLGRWEHRETEGIEGAKALVVGTGSIGREIARLLTVVGLHVEGVGRTDRQGDAYFGTVHASGRLASVVREFDYLVLVAPLTEATRGMVDATVLNAMKPTARLINVGRGELVVDGALMTALKQRRIAGAALDVFSTEPLPSTSELWQLDQVLISAHLSGDTVGWRHRLAVLFADNLDRYRHGSELMNVVDKRLGFVPAQR